MTFFAACNPANDVGKEVLPDDDLISGHFVDTFSIEFGTLIEDSVLTYNLSRTLVGNYVDEEFGHIFSQSYLQPRVTGSNLQFGADPSKLTLDSIVLSIDLLDFYGRFNDPIPLEIFELTQEFPSDTLLFSNNTLAFDSTYDLANGAALDFSELNGFFDFVEFRLDDSLGRKLLFADPDSLSNNAAFTAFFKGLVLRSKPIDQSISREPGGIFALDPRSDRTRLTIFYHDTTAAKSYTFQIDDNSDRFHRVTRTDFQSRLISSIVAENGQPDAMYGAVEAGALVKLYVGIPGMTDLNPAGINRAELILNVDESFFGSQNRFLPPSEVFLFTADTSHTTEDNPAIVNSSIGYDAVCQCYAIPITNTLQQILAGRLPSEGFIIVPGENGVTFNRAVFGGPGHPTLKPRLKVIYTSLPG